MRYPTLSLEPQSKLVATHRELALVHVMRSQLEREKRIARIVSTERNPPSEETQPIARSRRLRTPAKGEVLHALPPSRIPSSV
jgi:hypothetical protein